MATNTTDKTEIAQRLLELLEDAAPLASQLADLDPGFRAYHLASFEGQERGWLGSGFLIDAVRALADGADEDEDWD